MFPLWLFIDPTGAPHIYADLADCLTAEFDFYLSGAPDGMRRLLYVTDYQSNTLH